MLRRVVVFDTGWGGEAFADYLEKELSVVQVIRVIDWRNAPYCNKRKRQIQELVEEALAEYIDMVDAIVLASNVVSAAALWYLRTKHPNQIFVGTSWPTIRRKDFQKNVLMLTTKSVRRSRDFAALKRRWNGLKMQIVECDEWVDLIDDGEMTPGIMRHEFIHARVERPDIVVLGCTHLLAERDAIEGIFGWRARVADGNKNMLKNLCRALELRGGDGEYHITE